MERKLALVFAIAAGVLLTVAVVQAARRPAPPWGEVVSLAHPGLNTSAELTALPVTNAVSTTFTYQGLLADGGSPANGPYDFEFLLFDDPIAGSQLGMTVMLDDVSVADGLITAELNFGDVFDGRALWLEVRVRPGNDSGGFTILSPRIALTAAPYALSLRPGSTISGAITSTQQGVLNLGNSQGHGLVVFAVDNEGIVVSSAGGNGVQVDSAGSDGFYVGSAGGDGVYVSSADGDGLHISSTGNKGIQLGSTGGDGVFINSADNIGFSVQAAGSDGVYVGSADGDGVNVGSAAGHGVFARSTNALGYGGYFQNMVSGGSGVYAEAGDDPVNSPSPDLELGGTQGVIRSDTNVESSLRLQANGGLQIELDADNDTSNSFLVSGDAGGSVALIVDEAGNTTVFGNHSVIGTKSAIVEIPDQGLVKLYALESPENWFEDFGTASLMDGEATVTIEPVFAATVNLEEDYHVFLTPLGDCALYTAAKTATGFIVRALGGATCSIDFDYRIVAKRLGYEDLRLEPADFSQWEE